MSSGNRSASYLVEEDIHLCHIWLDVFQNPIIGINQSKDQFWSRVEIVYHSDPNFQMTSRTRELFRKRMQAINAAISKMRGCMRQIEMQRPSGASNEDIMNQSKILLSQDSIYWKGFKFEHVWHFLKDSEKFVNPNPTTNVPRPNSTDKNIGPNLSTFEINSTDDEVRTTSTARPMGVKKAKRKRKHDEGISKIIEQNNLLVELIKKNNQNSQRKLSLAEYKEENKILFKDLNSISDPNLCEHIRDEQIRIMNKRAQEQRSSSQSQRSEDEGQGSQNNNYGQYFDYLGGSRTNLSD